MTLRQTAHNEFGANQWENEEQHISDFSCIYQLRINVASEGLSTVIMAQLLISELGR